MSQLDYIKKIIFNTGQSIDINHNDIVIFVGPNNSGKSQSLKDLYELSDKKLNPVVIADIEVEKNTDDLFSLLEKIDKGDDCGNYFHYRINGKDINYNKESGNSVFLNNPYFNYFRDLFVINLDTTARLSICEPPNSINRDDKKQHPIHYAAYDKKYRKWLTENFHEAFGMYIYPDRFNGATIPLCISSKSLDEYDDQNKKGYDYIEEIDPFFKNSPQLHKQGDGMKSFTGILLYLMLDYYHTFLIDEPESFLHPPQARIMGQIIGKSLSDSQQAFISTHSEEIIKGLMETCPERIKIIRITRTGDTNSFSILDNDKFNELWKDSLLKHSNIMSAIFHKTVVLCESDSDCQMYSIIDSYLKKSEGKYSETMFIHCGGKQRMSKVALALKSLDIDVRLIPDIDVLNDVNVFRNIATTFGIEWSQIEKDYNMLVSNLHSKKEKIIREEVTIAINGIINSSDSKELSKAEIQRIRSEITVDSKWEPLKKNGVNGIPSGEATKAFNKIDSLLKDHEIYIVPVGELEMFIKDVGCHGPEWVNKVLDEHQDLNDAAYDGIKKFISEMKL